MAESSFQFPKGFAWGTATASYQIEGAHEEDGKGPSIWDEFSHRPGVVEDKTNGDVATDHYHRFPEDLAIMQEMGLNAYRFSISWSRILPDGKGKINEKGLDFYKRLTDAMLAKRITPFATLFHWDLPLALEKLGGFRNREISSWFAEYANVVARSLGDRVKHWMTLNEPHIFATIGHFLGVHAPGLKSPMATAQVIHNLLLSHGRAVQVLRSIDPKAKVGLANFFWPCHSLARASGRDASFWERRAEIRAQNFINRTFMDPIFKKKYPEGTGAFVHLFNIGRIRSADFDVIASPIDFMGVNHYSRNVVVPGWDPLIGFKIVEAKNLPFKTGELTEMGWEVLPHVFFEALTWVRNEYGPIPLYVTENGIAQKDVVEDGKVHDKGRIRYLQCYIEEMARAIRSGVDIRGYFVWTFMDNFEWSAGCSKRFGLVHIDYETLKRTPKESASWYSKVARENAILCPPT